MTGEAWGAGAGSQAEAEPGEKGPDPPWTPLSVLGIGEGVAGSLRGPPWDGGT